MHKPIAAVLDMSQWWWCEKNEYKMFCLFHWDLTFTSAFKESVHNDVSSPSLCCFSDSNSPRPGCSTWVFCGIFYNLWFPGAKSLIKLIIKSRNVPGWHTNDMTIINGQTYINGKPMDEVKPCPECAECAAVGWAGSIFGCPAHSLSAELSN